MKTYLSLMFSALAVFAVFSFGSTAEAADEICKVAAADTCHVVLENDKVRVIHYISKAGSKLAMHSHPDHVIYLLKDSKTRYTMPDGKTQDSAGKKGEARWVPAGDHASENMGGADTEVLVVEIKPAK